MSLPRWNTEWEKPDPLRGGRGWARHHYVSAGTAAILVFLALGTFVSAAAKAHRKAGELRRYYEQRQTAWWNSEEAESRSEW